MSTCEDHRQIRTDGDQQFSGITHPNVRLEWLGTTGRSKARAAKLAPSQIRSENPICEDPNSASGV
jgi:hypothetical protein